MKAMPVLVAAALLLTVPRTQDKPAASKVDGASAETQQAPAAEWPVAKPADHEKVLAQVEQLKKADAKLHEEAKKRLVALGPVAAPLVMGHVTDRADAAPLNRHLFLVLDQLLQRDHGALMAREAKKPKVELRRYLVRRLCRFAEPTLLAQLTATMQDKDEQTAFYAALGALALKHREALGPVLDYSKLHWPEVSALVAETLPAAKGRETAEWVFERIAKATAADQMAGLRLLRSLTDLSQAPLLKTYLAASDHAVKREAVNVARALHGEAPVDNLPVFQVIEMAKAWQQKLQ
jgi:hypothetical protein